MAKFTRGRQGASYWVTSLRRVGSRREEWGMDPLVTSVVVAASEIAVRFTGVVERYLRLRWRLRQEHARRRTLEALARALPAGSRLVEHDGDGSILMLMLAPEAKQAGARCERG